MFKVKKDESSEYSPIKKVLKENEIKANKLVAIALLVVGVWLFILFVLFIAGLASKDNLKVFGIACGVTGGVLFITFIISLIAKWNKPWLKYMLLYTSLVLFAGLSLFYGSVCAVFLLLPIILSTRYYFEKMSLSIAVLTVVLIFVCDVISISTNLFIDYNTVFVVDFLFNPNVTPPSEIIAHADKGRSILNYMIGNTFPKTVLAAVISSVCYIVSKHARLNLIKQTEETEKNARLSTELTLATEIQANMLPNIFPAFPDRKEFDIYALMNPAKEVGGDFYDMFMVDDNHLAITIADVSGKGVPAALFMVISKTLLNDNALLSGDVDSICNTVNKRLCQNNEAGLFVTAWMGILNIKTGVLKYVNAGHNPPLLISNDKVEFLKNRSGFFLAGRSQTRYIPYELMLNKGDKILLYTDGVTEAKSKDNAMYGNDRLQDFVTTNKNLPVEDLLKSVRKSVDDFAKDAEQFDDITMLCMEYKGTDHLLQKEKVFKSDINETQNAIDFVKEQLTEVESSVKTLRQIIVCFEEMFVNICHYAYKNKEGNITIKISFDETKYRVTLIDEGVEFNPLLNEDPDITLEPKKRKIGGLGIYMVKTIMDKVDYKRYDNQNVLTFEKFITKGE